MSARRSGTALAVLAITTTGIDAHAQTAIPLAFNGDRSRLIIYVGIDGGKALPYLFDTGSSLFNAVYNPKAWGTFNSSTFPTSTVPNGTGVSVSYGGGNGYSGNIVQIKTLTFAFSEGGRTQATLSATNGFEVNAVSAHTFTNNNDNSVTQNFPDYFNTLLGTDRAPPVEGTFYGTFGAGNFVTDGKYHGGSILGQASTGLIPGYVVAANGQANQVSPNTPKSGSVPSSITNCSPCVILGLNQAVLGQFMPFRTYPVTPSSLTFPNPNGSGAGNPSGNFFGSNLVVTLTPPGGAASQAVTLTAGGAAGLLDTGTPSFSLNTSSLGPLIASVGLGQTALNSSGQTVFNVNGGSTITVSGVTASGSVLPASTTTLVGANAANNAVYAASVGTNLNGTTSTYTATLGLSFFLQNSVLFDLQDNLIGYSPFFVTANDVQTTAGRSLRIDSRSVPIGLAGIISGPGGVTVGKGGSLQLSAVNTYTGPTNIHPGGSLLIVGTGSIASSSGVTNNGTFDISGAASAVTIPGLSGGGTVNLGGQTLVIQGDGNFSGNFADGGFYGGAGGTVAIASGTQTFSGVGAHTGSTMVAGGTLVMNGSLASDVLVGNRGTLMLNGKLGGNLVNTGTATVSPSGTVSGSVLNGGDLKVNGTVAGGLANMGRLSGSGLIAGNLINMGLISPGNSIGTLSIAANYTHVGNGGLSMEVSGAGPSDVINVGGTAFLQGGTVFAVATPGAVYAPISTYKIMTAAGGLNGTFASVNEPYPFLLSSLSYDANNAYLTLQIGGFAAAAATPAQFAVGAVLDANVFNATGDFASVLSAMAVNTLSNEAGQYVLQSLSGNNYAGFSSYMVQGAQFFMNNFASQAGGGGSPASTRVALAEACDVACDTVAPAKWGAWGGGLGGLGTIGGNAPVGGVTYNAGGFAAGLDRLVTDTLRVGVTAGYTAGAQWVNGFSGVGRSDTFQTGLYANYAQDKVYADALVGYAYTWNQMWRPISIPGLQPRTAMGQTGVNQFFGQIETGYRFDIGPLGAVAADAFITPFARLQAYTGNQNAFTETGAQSLNLTINGQGTNSLRTVLGAQIGGAMDLGWREKLAMVLRLGWSHEYADVSRPVTATLAGAPAMPFTTWGISPQRDGAVIGLSADTAIADATSVYLRYEGNISGQDNAHAFTAGLRMTW